MIISVGYRVKSIRGTQFRQWANSVLKEYLLHGYVINQRVERLEQRVAKTEEQIGFFIRTALPPVEGVFYDGQVFEAYSFAAGKVSSSWQVPCVPRGGRRACRHPQTAALRPCQGLFALRA